MLGPRVLLGSYVARVFLVVQGSCPVFSHPSWVVSLVLQNLIGAPWGSYGRLKDVFLVLKALFVLGPGSAGRLGVFHAVSYLGSHSRGWSEVSFSFVPGFVAKTQDPSSLAPRFAGFTVPAQPNARQSQWETYILCWRSGVTWSALLCIVSDASGSFLPQGVARRSYRRPLSPSGSGCRCHGYAGSRLRDGLFVSCEPSALVLSLSLFFEMSLAVILVGGHGCGPFHRSCVVAVQALVLPGPARLDVSLLTDWKLALGSCFLVRSPTFRRLPMGCHRWWFVYVSTF